MMRQSATSTACFQSYLNPKAVLQHDGLAGRGLFAAEPIARDELVCMWGGVVYREADLSSLDPELRHFLLQIDEGLHLGPRDLGDVDEAEFFNHSCDPNCGMRGQIALVALRDIAPGEELTFDYAMAETHDQEFACRCGSSLCRGTIRGTDYLLPNLRERYHGYFSGWLEKRLNDPVLNADYLKNFDHLGAWGIDTNLDLHNCNPEIIRDREAIYRFTVELCERIGVRRFGEPIIVHFGEDERVAGYSLVQLIETSLISGHFANLTNRVYLDIFSCAYYDPQKTARFAHEFFQAESLTVHTHLRF